MTVDDLMVNIGSFMMRLLVLFMILSVSLASVPKPPRVVGGQDTTIERWPFMVNMMIGFFGAAGQFTQACGGTLITRSLVLTACHCVYLDPPVYWQARLGSSFRSSGGVVIPSYDFRFHPDYIPGRFNSDVALVLLQSPATLSESVGTAMIAAPRFPLPDGLPVVTIGWGTLSLGGSHPEVLQEATFYTVNQDLCAERYRLLQQQPLYDTIPEVDESMLCAGIIDVGGTDSCQGDSGGPIVYNNNIVVGVVSWGVDCGDSTYPGVKARVSNVSDWIVSLGANWIKSDI